MAPPDKLRIEYEPDEWGRFHYIGRLKDGTQFMAFVTGAFPGKDRYPDTTGDWRNVKRWLAVLHKFDAEGNHLFSEARHGGFDIEGDDAGEKAFFELDQILEQTEAEPCDIYVKPFSVEIKGIYYELVYEKETNEEGEEWECVMLWPNDIMFHPPWDSGEYST
jgi:hypothetical protein